jgi:hypothetical protein
MLKPTVSVGEPAQKHGFTLVEKDGISIYLSQAVKHKPGVKATISLQGMWIFKELEVQGLSC